MEGDSKVRLNLGCGNLRMPGFKGVDYRPGPTVDVVLDLTKHPWPFDDNSIEEVRAWHFLEHLPGYELDQAVREIHRILRPGGLLYVKVPLGLPSLYSPFHFHAFDRKSFDVWIALEQHGSLQPTNLFRRVSQQVVFNNGFPLQHVMRLLPWTRGTFYDVDERGPFSYLPTATGRELREWLVKL